MAPTVRFLVERGIPVMGHVGLTPQAVNVLGGYGARGRTPEEAAKIVADAKAVAEAGAFALVIEGVVEPIAIEITLSPSEASSAAAMPRASCAAAFSRTSTPERSRMARWKALTLPACGATF